MSESGLSSRYVKQTKERLVVVAEAIRSGSQPHFPYYLLATVSSLLACFGLIANSAAVIIGAMLVAPLMLPIFGIALALVRGDTKLLWQSIKAEVLGILLAVGLSYGIGQLPLAIELTDEMIGRMRPNALDVLVAILAGLAGTYALLDEKISPSMPGVAIAVAIVPPLSNCGLLLALGEPQGALGSFTLFLHDQTEARRTEPGFPGHAVASRKIDSSPKG